MTWSGVGQQGDVSGIYAQRSNVYGESQGSVFRVNSANTNGDDPVVAINEGGNFIIAWQEEGDIYARQFDGVANPTGGPFRVNTYANDSQLDPSVAMDTDGDFVVTWTSLNQDGRRYGIYAQRYSASGDIVGEEFRVNTYTTTSHYNWQMDPTVSMNASGSFVITWTSLGQDGHSMPIHYGTGFDIYFQRYDANGDPIGGETRANVSTYSHQFNSSIAMDADGDFVATWLDIGGNIYAQRFNGEGVMQGDMFQVNILPVGVEIEENVVVAMDPNGNFVISWDNGGSYSENIYARRYRANGDELGGLLMVNSYTTNQQTNASISMDADGDFVVAWSSYGQDGSFTGIYAQRYGEQNEAPAAYAGGPYAINENESLQLDASASFDPDFDAITSYAWDVNGDGVFTDAFGVTPILTWTQLTAIGLAGGDTISSLRVRVEDADGDFTISAPVTLTINAKPSIEIVGPGVAVRGQPRNYALTASDPTPGDDAAGFMYQIDWDGNGSFEQSVVGLSALQVTHVFTNVGTYNVRVRASDTLGAFSQVRTMSVTVSAWSLELDQSNPGTTNMVWGGTTGSDGYVFLPGLVLKLAENNQFFGTPKLEFIPSFNGKLFVYGQSGGDLILADVLLNPIVAYGGEGDDVIIGGRGGDTMYGGVGSDIIFGGTLDTDGNDLIDGGAGNDFIVGHWGADTLRGGTGSDLLLAGAIRFNSDMPGATYAIQAEWLSARPIANKVDNILGGGFGPRFNLNFFLQPGSTALNDTAVDQVIGEGDADWLFYTLAEDLAPDLHLPDDLATNLV